MTAAPRRDGAVDLHLDSLVTGLCEAAGMTPLEYEIDRQERVRVTPNDPARDSQAKALEDALRSRARLARSELVAMRERERFFLTPLQLEQDGASVRLTFETKEHRETWCAHFLQRVQDANRDAALTPKEPHART